MEKLLDLIVELNQAQGTKLAKPIAFLCPNNASAGNSQQLHVQEQQEEETNLPRGCSVGPPSSHGASSPTASWACFVGE